MPQQKDIFDQALEELKAPAATAAAPQPADSWQQSFEKHFPAQAQAAHQVGQVGQGLMQLAGSVSPLRFREGWDQPTLEVPEAAHAFIHPLNTLANMIGGIGQAVGTVGREAGALAAPNAIQAPSQPEMDQATRSTTGMAAGLMAGPAMAEAGGAIQGAATEAGLPQAMTRAGSFADATPSWMLKHPAATAAKAIVGPALRAGGKALYDVTRDPKAQMTKVGEYIPPPNAPPAPSEGPIDVAHQTIKPKAKAVEAPTAPKQLAPVPPGTQTFEGAEGGLGPQTHPDIVAQDAISVRAYKGDGTGKQPGAYRLETPNEMKARLTTFGRGTTKQPNYDAQPLKLPKPTPPKKSK